MYTAAAHVLSIQVNAYPAQMRTLPSGERVDDDGEDSASSPEARWARLLTRHYATLGTAFPELFRLRELAKLQAAYRLIGQLHESVSAHLEGLPDDPAEMIRAEVRCGEGWNYPLLTPSPTSIPHPHPISWLARRLCNHCTTIFTRTLQPCRRQRLNWQAIASLALGAPAQRPSFRHTCSGPSRKKTQTLRGTLCAVAWACGSAPLLMMLWSIAYVRCAPSSAFRCTNCRRGRPARPGGSSGLSMRTRCLGSHASATMPCGKRPAGNH